MATIAELLSGAGLYPGAQLGYILSTLGIDPNTIQSIATHYGLKTTDTGLYLLTRMGLTPESSGQEFIASARAGFPGTEIDPFIAQINQSLGGTTQSGWTEAPVNPDQGIIGPISGVTQPPNLTGLTEPPGGTPLPGGGPASTGGGTPTAQPSLAIGDYSSRMLDLAKQAGFSESEITAYLQTHPKVSVLIKAVDDGTIPMPSPAQLGQYLGMKPGEISAFFTSHPKLATFYTSLGGQAPTGGGTGTTPGTPGPGGGTQPPGPGGGGGGLPGTPGTPGEAFFPQQPPITLPPGMTPQPFQPPAPPNLPTGITLPPELQSLFQNLQTQFQQQQDTRNSLLAAIQQAQQQQDANMATNQPMLDAALANIQSVLTGQAASPGLQGLVDSAYGPILNEGQRRLRQTAEEAAAARGMSLTDTPIGQPYLEENRRFLEQMGGQQSQALIGLRSQDAAFSERVREFQEGLRQQAMTNRMDVVRSLGTPEQAGQVLGNLGLGARQAALGEFQAQGNQALGASNLALQSALGGANAGLNLGQFGLQSQNQGFNQYFSQQQAAVQNQLAALQALGDPFSAYGSQASTGFNFSQLPQTNINNLLQSLIGQGVSFPPTGSTTTQNAPGQSQVGNYLGGLGAFLYGLGRL